MSKLLPTFPRVIVGGEGGNSRGGLVKFPKFLKGIFFMSNSYNNRR